MHYYKPNSANSREQDQVKVAIYAEQMSAGQFPPLLQEVLLVGAAIAAAASLLSWLN